MFQRFRHCCHIWLRKVKFNTLRLIILKIVILLSLLIAIISIYNSIRQKGELDNFIRGKDRDELVFPEVTPSILTFDRSSEDDNNENLTDTIRRLFQHDEELRRDALKEIIQTLGSKGNVLSQTTNHSPNVIIITTWRSGSSFLGQLISSHPGVYYHYEPLMHFGFTDINSGKNIKANKALFEMAHLLSCDYYTLEEYIENAVNRKEMFFQNKKLWPACEIIQEACYDAKFLSAVCKLFPIQLIKTVRVRLKNAIRLLREEKLIGNKLLFLLLVRDPRAVINSRRNTDWCRKTCIDVKKLCSELIDDMQTAKEVLATTARLQIIRYEDLVRWPLQTTEKIFKFIGLNTTFQVIQFLQSHSIVNISNMTSNQYVKLATDKLQLWQRHLPFELVQEIQEACYPMIKMYGYRIFNCEDDLRDKGGTLYKNGLPSEHFY